MEIKQTSAQLVALQVVGSPTSQFYFDLSVLYAAEVVCPPGFTLLFAVAYPDGRWSVSPTLDPTAPRRSLGEMIAAVAHVNLVVPHLFCATGLTGIRTFFEDILGLPLVGSAGHVLRIAQDKRLTRLLAQTAAVPVPDGGWVDTVSSARAVAATIGYPLIVKPNRVDNSDGLSLVQAPAQLEEALRHAFTHDAGILLEAFIPGREIRGAVIERAGTLQALPYIEYGVSADHPIRTAADKLKFGENGELLAQADKEHVPAHCPAHLDPSLAEKLLRMMTRLHRTLGCRDFSMYDFRVHQRTGEPYLLEAGLFWSFSETSMISSMLAAAGTDLTDATEALWQQAAERR